MNSPGFTFSRIILSLVLILFSLPAYQTPATDIGGQLPDFTIASVTDLIPGIDQEVADRNATFIFNIRDTDDLYKRYISPGLPDNYPAPFQRKKKPKGVIPKTNNNKETLPFQKLFWHQESSFRYFISKEKLLSCKFADSSFRIRPPPIITERG